MDAELQKKLAVDEQLPPSQQARLAVLFSVRMSKATDLSGLIVRALTFGFT